MPRRSTRTPPAATRRPSGPFIVLNPRDIPKGKHIIKWHVCLKEREENDHSGCEEKTWFEGDAFDPPKGFGLERFLAHQPGAGCEDEGHENCAGPFLREVE